MVFRDRDEAGKKLAQKLAKCRKSKPLVLAIPRGGVVIGKEIADFLSCPLDIIVTKKLGAPHEPELAIGAVDPDGDIVIDDRLAKIVGADKGYIKQEASIKKEEILRRMRLFRPGKEDLSVGGKTVILTDDGIATGATMEAAIRYVIKKSPKKIILAIPVASPESISKLKDLVDEVVCLEEPSFFSAVGQFYQDFPQISDEEVLKILTFQPT
ncbi:MAG TPA: phosphoribosyltransferase [Candidatus Bathyarchaeia archaeon]|nr:phosphoribosyltransferase [Candidatus Bathyarchaeia archaeon]